MPTIPVFSISFWLPSLISGPVGEQTVLNTLFLKALNDVIRDIGNTWPGRVIFRGANKQFHGFH